MGGSCLTSYYLVSTGEGVTRGQLHAIYRRRRVDDSESESFGEWLDRMIRTGEVDVDDERPEM